MPDVDNATVWTIPSETEGEPDRQYVLTIDVDPATGKPVVGAREVTYDENYQSGINTTPDDALPADDDSFSLVSSGETTDSDAANTAANTGGNE